MLVTYILIHKLGVKIILISEKTELRREKGKGKNVSKNVNLRM